MKKEQPLKLLSPAPPPKMKGERNMGEAARVYNFASGKGSGNAEQHNLIKLFLDAKRIEGCSPKTLTNYGDRLEFIITTFLRKSADEVTTEDLRRYFGFRQDKISPVSMNNERRVLLSFFSWLENEEWIAKSPMRRIGVFKEPTRIKHVITDEQMLKLLDYCRDKPRELALIELLASTGMRVGELVKLNRSDIDFQNRECIVFGKGRKERRVFFDAATKTHLQNYLNSRRDDDPALFVSYCSRRLQAGGIEVLLRNIGNVVGVPKVHPHKFRRTLATKAIAKGMPLEQVQHMLGHKCIQVTTMYAMVDADNVKIAHQRYLS
jgi:site-specific recombinase XerD